ncbi:ROK family protein [Virgibacillus sp. NKC19-16]|uniref:N-acetylglucosamine kinase n=1 Tax=Virgibacillus salidurans TaxID=2831673 RepID=UPI001F332C51|nr:BadF/BadG/BcrA/BcrD ATPase family protein [Virgibacillus sp. NKC19-16]UJL45402.1 ROK family protein [Virgibacillus sp. NKC19-16]
MNYVIGIDGGGTKTKAVIVDMKGKVVAQETVGPTNPNVVSKKELQHTFQTLFHSLRQQAPPHFSNILSVFAGVSGAGNATNKKVLQETIEPLIENNIPIQIEADAINALYSGSYGAPGIVQIAGTGSITYGINSNLEHHRVGGWGYLFGDEGSGYDIGRKGIMAALQSVDGRASETILLPMIYAHFNVTNAQDLIRGIYASPTSKSEISPVAEIVFQGFKDDDPIAEGIIAEAVKETTLSIKALYEKLFYVEEKVEVVLCGGVFQEKNILPRLIKEDLRMYPAMKVVLPEMPPVGGSIIGAYLMQGVDVDEAIIDTIRKTINRKR